VREGSATTTRGRDPGGQLTDVRGSNGLDRGETWLVGQPHIRHVGHGRLDQVGGHQWRQVGVGRVHVRPGAGQRVRGGVVGPAGGGLNVGPGVVEDQRGAVVDQVNPAVPQQHVRVAPRPVDIADQRVEPEDPAARTGSTVRASTSRHPVGSRPEVGAGAGPKEVLDLLVRS
jgi:hypothetical protein